MSDIVERLGVLSASLANPQVAVEAQREIERLRAELATAKELLLEMAGTAEYAAHQLGKARIWGGTEWHYNPLHPIHYRPAIERLRDMLPRIHAALGDEP